MGKKVSIIIPVYNGEAYLNQCLGNLVHQTLEDIEILLVDDGSQDRSLEILKECQKQFPQKVRVLQTEKNSGAGGARNRGIEAANGEYIGFVDCDDMVDTTMYEKLYKKAAETGADIVDTGYYRQDTDTALVHTADHMTGILDNAKRKELIVSGGYVFSKLFRSSLFADETLRFRENCILEDADFLTYAFATAGTMENVKEVLYLYRDQAGSLSKLSNPEKYYRSILEAMEAIYSKVGKRKDYKTYREAVEYELLQMYSYGVNACLKDFLEQNTLDTQACLSRLARWKKSHITGDYSQKYVQAKISETDQHIMRMNDTDPKKLIELISQGEVL